MIISSAEKFVWISMPRCCTHTLMVELHRRFNGQFFYDNRMVGRHRGVHRNKIPPGYEDYFHWTCCRNPYTRAISMFWYLLKHPRRKLNLATFEEYCEHIAERASEDRTGPLWPMWQQVGGARIDQVVRFEHFADDLGKLPFWQGTTQLYRRAPSKPDKPPAELLTPKCVKLIQEWGARDFEMFGYPMEPPL